jgi:catechol 2,3-dioxygenase-like lactoylglutathione lyase family enzyme
VRSKAIVHIEHVACNVPDPVAQAEWYTRHLAMRVVRSIPASPHTRFLADQAGRVVLEVYHQAVAPIPDYRAMDPLIFHIAFAVADVARSREELLAAGAASAGEVVTTATGDVLAMLRDPWGIAIQLVKRARPLLEGLDEGPTAMKGQR